MAIDGQEGLRMDELLRPRYAKGRVLTVVPGCREGQKWYFELVRRQVSASVRRQNNDDTEFHVTDIPVIAISA